MRITLLKNYGLSTKGDVLDTSKPIADLLIGRKVAKMTGERNKGKSKNIKERING